MVAVIQLDFLGRLIGWAECGGESMPGAGNNKYKKTRIYLVEGKDHPLRSRQAGDSESV